jgi:hypothetical protein
VCELVTRAGQIITYESLPEAPHVMNLLDPALFARLLVQWEATLPGEAETASSGVLAR